MYLYDISRFDYVYLKNKIGSGMMKKYFSDFLKERMREREKEGREREKGRERERERERRGERERERIGEKIE